MSAFSNLRRRWRPLVFSVAGAALMGAAVPAAALADPLPTNCTGTTTVTCTFTYNGTNGVDGTPQPWTVPPGVTSANFDLLGAVGAGGPQGGLGGETTGTVALTSGATVNVLVGAAGSSGRGGYNGGGDSTYGGGGATDIRVGGTGLGNRVLVAGGGGGAGICGGSTCSVGGAGGGTTGGHGRTTAAIANPNPAALDSTSGGGGTQTDGGVAPVGAGHGTSGQGGYGGTFAGGGGGGYFGGAGGGSFYDQNSDPYIVGYGGGGGGSGFVLPDTTRVTGGATFNGMGEGEGLATLTYTTAPPTATTVSVTSSNNPSTPAQSVTFTATVGPNDGSGTVAFYADGSMTPLSGCDAVPLTDSGGSWQAACTMASGFPAGTHPISASYSGSALYAASSGNLPGGQKVTSASPAKPSIRIADASGPEGNSGSHPLNFRVTLNKSTTVPVTVQWGTASGTAKAPSDFVAASGTLTFSPGQTARTISVQVKGDKVKEPNEVFYVLMRNPHNATIADPNSSGGIFNDD